MTRTRPLKIFFDGGCRPNPGPIEVAVVARGETWFFDDLGEGGSADAEWLALCLALETAHRLGVPSFDLIGDSRSIVEQANGVVPCRTSASQAHRERFRAASAVLAPRRIRWVARQQNLAGIALAKRHVSVGGVDGPGFSDEAPNLLSCDREIAGPRIKSGVTKIRGGAIYRAPSPRA